jgi:hypothetical protein
MKRFCHQRMGLSWCSLVGAQCFSHQKFRQPIAQCLTSQQNTNRLSASYRSKSKQTLNHPCSNPHWLPRRVASTKISTILLCSGRATLARGLAVTWRPLWILQLLLCAQEGSASIIRPWVTSRRMSSKPRKIKL